MNSTRRHLRVTFEPEGRAVHVLEGSTLIEAAVRAGIVLDTPCGGQGTCGKCLVDVTHNAPPPTEAERRHLAPDALAKGARLACQTRVTRDMTVVVPVSTRLFEQKILTDGLGREVTLHPTVAKHHLSLDPPSLEDQRSDADRLLEAIGEPLEPTLAALGDIPVTLRDSAFRVTAVAAEGRLIAVEPGDTTKHNLGIAFDIGTTTVVGFLIDLCGGRDLGVAARTNPQVALGDDVVSRIAHAMSGPSGLKELQTLIVGCLNDITTECCRQAGVDCAHLYEATVVGNTTMNHLFLGVTPRFVAEAPYVAALRRPVNVPAREIGLRIHPRGLVHTLPNIAGFVGADTVGVILATGLHEAERPCAAVDIGTNGELVMSCRGRLVACSTAAGPAFEGARIRFGMRAADGAIDNIVINDDLEYNVIGDQPPRGLCGTALIDLVAELLRVGAVDPTGRLLGPQEFPRRTPETIRRRVKEGENGYEFIIVPADEGQADGPIVLTQRDVRELQLAKGAIAAGLRILLREMGLGIEDLHRVLLAGAFGNFIRRSMAQRIGLLPELPHDRILFIGNAAGAGARMALLSKKCKEEANAISERTRYLELAGRPDFQTEFAEAMLFPEG